MRFLIISERGATVSLAAALEREGHSATVHIVDPSRSTLGLGMSMCVRTPRPLRDSAGSYNLSTVEWLFDTARPDLTIFDDRATHVMASRMRKAGRPVLGPTSDVVDLITAPLEGTAQTVGWFDGNGVIGPVLSGRMYDRYMPDDVGPIAPMSGFLLHEAIGDDPGLAALRGLVSELKRTTYRGPIWAQSKGYDVCAGPGWTPCHWGWFENFKGKIGQFLMGLAQSTTLDGQAWSPWVSGVRLSLPPWPYNVEMVAAPAPVNGLSEPALRHFWFEDIYRKSTDEFVCNHVTNCLGFVTSRGEDPREAIRRMYRTVGNLSVAGLQYRTDIGRLPVLKQEALNGHH